jgi:hypothetical protein
MQKWREQKHEKRKGIRKNTHSRLYGTYIKSVIRERSGEKRNESRLI